MLLFVNSVLFVAMPAVGAKYNTNLFAQNWVDPEIASIGRDLNVGQVTDSDVNTEPQISENSITAEGTDSSTTNIPLVIAWVPFLREVWTFLTFMLFGFVFALQAIGAPPYIIFIIGAPLSMIEILTIFNLVLRGIAAITGVFT